MESLFSEILLDIFSRVHVESVFVCKLVCKKWLTLLRDSGTYFNNMHFSHQLNQLYGGDNIATTKVVPNLIFAGYREKNYSAQLIYHGGQITDKININEKYSYKENLKRINHPPMHNYPYHRLVGSCNGLICTFIHHHQVLDPIYIFNPITREYCYLPQLVEPKYLFDRLSCGFGYARSTNEFKVVRIYYPVDEGHVEVYTLGSGYGWRAKGTIRIRMVKSDGAGIYVNGAIYWIGLKNVVAFDLDDEEFRMFPYPPGVIIKNDRSEFTYGVVALGGRLCFYLEDLRLKIWSLKKTRSNTEDKGIWFLFEACKEIWCLDFDISFEGVEVDRWWTWFRPILLTENKELMLVYHDRALYCYDSKTSILKMTSYDEEVATKFFTNIEAIPHINTFASLQAMGEKSKKYLVSDVWRVENNEIEEL